MKARFQQVEVGDPVASSFFLLVDLRDLKPINRPIKIANNNINY